MNALLDIDMIDGPVDEYLRSIGDVFSVFNRATQSGNISYGVRVGGERYFVKTAGTPETPSCFSHEERLVLLTNVISVDGDVEHAAVPRILNAIGTSNGPALVYPWVDGELLDVPRAERDNPASSYYRFRHLPVSDIVTALDSIFEVHAQLAARKWIAVDFYDGSLIYDFDQRRLSIIDLDCYHRGPFVNTMGEMFGSSRFKAPEESTLHAGIDQRTTVFTLGRFIAVFLSEGTMEKASFRGTQETFDVMTRACQSAPDDRFPSVADFYAAWKMSL